MAGQWRTRGVLSRIRTRIAFARYGAGPYHPGMNRAVSLVLALAALLSTPAAAGTVKGGVTVDGVAPIFPKWACALVVRESYDARNDEIVVVMTMKPFDAAKVASSLDPASTLGVEPAVAKGDSVLVYLRRDGGISFNASHGYGDAAPQYANSTAMGDIRAELTAKTAARVAGRVFMPKPEKLLGGESMKLDVTFDAEIVRPPAGSPLPAGGGEPGKSLLGLLDAVAKRRWADVQAGVTPALRKDIVGSSSTTEKEFLDDAAKHFALTLPPKGLAITRGTLRADEAVLEIEGQQWGHGWVFFARMVKGGGGWLLDRSYPIGRIAE